jgi:hypothetical protein
MSDATKDLSTYLNDHLTGSTFAVELAGHAASKNAGTALGDFLAALRTEIEEDRHTLMKVMAALGTAVDRLKRPVAWLAEKVARLKPNGRLVGYAPLGRLEELELLAIGIEGKRLLWVALADTHAQAVGPELLADLIARAERQRADVEQYRLAAAREALVELPADAAAT